MKARDNPFSTDRILRFRYRFPDGLTAEQMLQRFAAMDYCGALIGPEGSGKTTLLEDLEPTLAAQGFNTKWLRLDQTTRTFSTALLKNFYGELGQRDIILFDGAEQLSCLAWQQFKLRSCKAAGLLITTHRPGRLPALLECMTSPKLLEEIVRGLIGDEIEGIDSPELFRKHKGNLRNALRELYDVYAKR